MKRFLALSLLCVAPFGWAQAVQPVTVRWGVPTLCADGSPITNCPISGYKVYGAKQGVLKVLLATKTAAADTAALTVTGPGTYCYDVTALSGADESAHSVESCITFKAPLPGSPTNVTVTVTIPAP